VHENDDGLKEGERREGEEEAKESRRSGGGTVWHVFVLSILHIVSCLSSVAPAFLCMLMR
jgi:hypothetical protein